uniref:Uncharacterized protein LOC114328353 n=1 Tax=Diabrotica virgifera virgifera TaxID=50390 RepID=A0A6P7G5W5_DIAVI
MSCSRGKTILNLVLQADTDGTIQSSSSDEPQEVNSVVEEPPSAVSNNVNITTDMPNFQDENSDSEPFQDSGSEYMASTESNESDEETHNQSLNELLNETETVTSPIMRKRSRKSDVNYLNWERNKNKLKRMKGESYQSCQLDKDDKYKKIERDERKMGPPCQCKNSQRSLKFFCNIFEDDDRKNIFNMFWKNLDWNQKKIYVTSLVDKEPVKYHRTGIYKNLFP